MKIVFTPDVSEQKIFAVGAELATVMGHDRDEQGHRVYSYPDTQEELVTILQNPVLMTDLYKIMQIQDISQRIAVEILQTKAERVLEYDGFMMKWSNSNQYPGLRFPSIDTIFLCSCLQQLSLPEMKQVVEIGCGPGFVGRYLKHKYPSIENMVLNDINPSAQKYFEETNEDPQIQFVLEDGKELLKSQKFDLIISNPPYIPRPKSIDDNPYEGLSLVVDMIRNLPKTLHPGGAMILVLPNLAQDVLDPVLDNDVIKVEELGAKEVPLKVSNILMNKEWLKYLVDQKGLKQEMKDGYEYRQTIKIIKFSVNENQIS